MRWQIFHKRWWWWWFTMKIALAFTENFSGTFQTKIIFGRECTMFIKWCHVRVNILRTHLLATHTPSVSNGVFVLQDKTHLLRNVECLINTVYPFCRRYLFTFSSIARLQMADLSLTERVCLGKQIQSFESIDGGSERELNLQSWATWHCQESVGRD